MKVTNPDVFAQHSSNSTERKLQPDSFVIRNQIVLSDAVFSLLSSHYIIYGHSWWKWFSNFNFHSNQKACATLCFRLFLWSKLSYPSLVCPVHKSCEVFHPAISVWILEEHAAHILPTEVHLMRQFQHRFHSDVAATKRWKPRGYFSLKRDIVDFHIRNIKGWFIVARKPRCSDFLFTTIKELFTIQCLSDN